jgi:hypothetical protein
MTAKSQQLQIRVTPQQKAALRRLAAGAGLDISGYVLSHLLPPKGERFRELLEMLRNESDRRFALAELHDLLVGCAAVEYPEVVARADHGGLPALMQNYVAAMVEQAGAQKGVAPPAWVADIAPLEQPHFATPLKSLRLHLLQASPVPFKRRNIFIDTSLGGRI